MTRYVCLKCGAEYHPGDRHVCEMEPREISTPIENGFRILGASIEAGAVILADALRENEATP